MIAPQRILHLDMDAFFAEVEMQRDPSLRGKPVIVGGAGQRGVVSTASYEARKFGVHSAMPIAQARKLCPHGIFVSGHYALYSAASRQVFDILRSVSPLVQPASIDEAYVDVTGSLTLFGGDGAIAAYIKKQVRETTGLPCTVAIAPNKLLAKVASGEAKPDGYRCIEQGMGAAFLAPLDVRKLPGAGPKTCKQLESLGILTIGELASAPARQLERLFGSLTAEVLRNAARGEGVSLVSVGEAPKSISRETTFENNLTDWNEIARTVAQLAERCASSLRDERLETRRIGLKVRSAAFETRTYAATLPEPSCIDADINAAVQKLLQKARRTHGPVRLIGVQLSSLSRGQHQLLLFEGGKTEKWERVLTQVDQLRGRLGFGSLHFGRAIDTEKKK